MTIVIAPDSFKECLSAKEVAASIASGVQTVFPAAKIIQIPLSDGGEGLLDALAAPLHGKLISVEVKDPIFRAINAKYCISGDGTTAIIEMATASGLELLLENEKNPLITTSFGVGQLILDALQNNCTKIIVGLGGSATNDGGIGMIRALGGKFLNDKNEEIAEGGGTIGELSHIDFSKLNPKIKTCKFIAACDVSNPLTGEKGASFTFGTQKGGTEEDLIKLDSNLKHYATILNTTLGINVDTIKGAGAAGGLGASLFGILGAKMTSGIDLITDYLQLDEKIQHSDLVITGEGKIDNQTLYGKAIMGIAKIAKKHKVPVIAIAGKVDNGIDEIYKKGISSVFSIVNEPMTLEKSIEQADDLIKQCVENIMRTMKNIQLN
ncbi:MAG: glycerate kinase [Cyclobacteriaceae bacterium]|nr:glycerate kinase [Cyclobacteriaceae bacterium]